MLENTLHLLPDFGNYFVTYLIHSTVLLGGAWCVLKVTRTASHALRERVWKMAAMLAIVTPLLQMAFDIAPVIDLTFGETKSPPPSELQTSAEQPQDKAIKPAIVLPDSVTPPVATESADGHPVTTDDEIASLLASGDSSAELVGEELENRPTAIPEFVEGTREVIGRSEFMDDVDVASLSGVTAAEPFVATDEPLIRRILGPASLLMTLILLAGILRMVSQSWVFHRRLRRCGGLNDGVVRSTLDSLLVNAGIRWKVTLLESPNYLEPVSFGILRWRIVVPDTLEARLTHAEIRAVLAHELAHLVRGDTLWLAFGRWLCTCFAIQPLNFLARREWRRAAEFQCDDWAVGNNVNALTLARCLTVVAEWRINERACATTLAAGGAKSDLTGRVERLVEGRTSRDPWATRLRRLATVVGCFVAAGTLVAWGPRTILFAANADGDEMSESATVESDGREDVASVIEQESMTDELAQLEHELDLLRHEMQELDELLQNSKFPERVRVLARRLSERMKQLQDRRELLKGSL